MHSVFLLVDLLGVNGRGIFFGNLLTVLVDVSTVSSAPLTHVPLYETICVANRKPMLYPYP